MKITEPVKVTRKIYVAPCLECGNEDIQVEDLGYNTSNQGGAMCHRCGNSVMTACTTDPTKKDLAAIWNKKNDIETLIAEKQAVIDKAQDGINDLLLRKSGQERIYLAGPDVFRPDAVERGEYLKRLCAEHGMVGMYPFDNAVPEGLAGVEAAKWISQANMDMIRQCTGVLINLEHFRGKEPDSGTAFEFGMAIALGKPVYAYFKNQGTLRDQIPHNEAGADADGFHVEDFGLSRNLMMACTWLSASETVEQAVTEIAKLRGKSDV